MMNLLPPEEQKELGRERLRRFLVVSGLAVSLVFFSGAILMLPAYLALEFRRAGLERNLSISKKAPLAGEVGAIEAGIRDLNFKLELWGESAPERRQVAGPVDRILKLAPAAVSVRSIFYEASSKTNPERVTLKGKAGNRAALLGFADALEKSGIFKEVHSPVSNLLKEVDVDFSLILDLG